MFSVQAMPIEHGSWTGTEPETSKSPDDSYYAEIFTYRHIVSLFDTNKKSLCTSMMSPSGRLGSSAGVFATKGGGITTTTY